MAEEFFVFGASGHGKVVIDTLRRAGADVALLVDDAAACKGTFILGQIVAGGREVLLADKARVGRGIVAIGGNPARLAVAAWLREQGFAFGSAIDPSAVVSATARIGAGSLVMAQAAVLADARIGEHVIINTAASVDHDCVVEDGAHLAPGVRLCGGVRVGAGALVGAGSVVVPGIRIGAGAIVGAGSTVLADIPAGVRAAGSPCRVLEPQR